MPTNFVNPAAVDWRLMYGGTHVKLREEDVALVKVFNKSQVDFRDIIAAGEEDVLYGGQYEVPAGHGSYMPTFVAKFFFGNWDLSGSQWGNEIRRLWLRYGMGGTLNPLWVPISTKQIYVEGKTDRKDYTSDISVATVRIANKSIRLEDFGKHDNPEDFKVNFTKVFQEAPVINTHVEAPPVPQFEYINMNREDFNEMKEAMRVEAPRIDLKLPTAPAGA